jgi:hypothetical protein
MKGKGKMKDKWDLYPEEESTPREIRRTVSV